MSRESKLPFHIQFRLALARSIHKRACEMCDTSNDIFALAQGLIAFHDSLDNFCAAIVSHLAMSSKGGKGYLLDSVNAIEEYERRESPEFRIPCKTEIGQLNIIRNDIKHHGIVPDIELSKGLLEGLTAFFDEYCRRYFGLEWNAVSMSDLLEDKAVREMMKAAENAIEAKSYKEALNQLAVVKFRVFEERRLKAALNPNPLFYHSEDDIGKMQKLRNAGNIFPRHVCPRDVGDRVDMLERGIDMKLMEKFERIVPEVGIGDYESHTLILEHGSNWGEPNWTRENAIFCCDFLINSILKYERVSRTSSSKTLLTLYMIRVRDQLRISDPLDEVVYVMEKGEMRQAMIPGRVDLTWEIYSIGGRMIQLYDDNNKIDVVGFFNNDEKDKIEFLETLQWVKEKGKDWILLERREGG
jgi:hypothetical protein